MVVPHDWASINSSLGHLLYPAREGPIVNSLIVSGLKYKELGHLLSSLVPPRDSGPVAT
jgi:hypothetical protein